MYFLNLFKWILGYTNDDNWTRQVIICDSMQMVSRKQAIVYVNGIKTTVFAGSATDNRIFN